MQHSSIFRDATGSAGKLLSQDAFRVTLQTGRHLWSSRCTSHSQDVIHLRILFWTLRFLNPLYHTIISDYTTKDRFRVNRQSKKDKLLRTVYKLIRVSPTGESLSCISFSPIMSMQVAFASQPLPRTAECRIDVYLPFSQQDNIRTASQFPGYCILNI